MLTFEYFFSYFPKQVILWWNKKKDFEKIAWFVGWCGKMFDFWNVKLVVLILFYLIFGWTCAQLKYYGNKMNFISILYSFIQFVVSIVQCPLILNVCFFLSLFTYNSSTHFVFTKHCSNLSFFLSAQNLNFRQRKRMRFYFKDFHVIVDWVSREQNMIRFKNTDHILLSCK